MDVIQQLQQLALEQGLTLTERAPGHWQISGGPLLVNYYPFAKKRSAYVAGTSKASYYTTPAMAIAMAFEIPDGLPTKRRSNYKKVRRRLLRRSTKCHWCTTQLTLETSTLDHIIPLSRGGLDNANNWCLACLPCNQARGNAMPELQRVAR